MPATRLAEERGRKVVLNIVMVGVFAAVTGLIEAGALAQSDLRFRPAAHGEAEPESV